MDIHTPEGPTNSFKDFAIHIVIVTIGILIALGLEGAREKMYEHQAIRNARENFQAEFKINRNNLNEELKNDKEIIGQLDSIVAALPKLRSNPSQLSHRIADLTNPSAYFFSNSSWESEVSTGALSHMSVEEVNRYSEVNFLVRAYTSRENQAFLDWGQMEAFSVAHQNLTPAEINSCVQKLVIYRIDVKVLSHIGEEFSRSLNNALEHR
ncbi:MAG: hypothetical protein ABI286_11980 [Edaphobacter sp.]